MRKLTKEVLLTCDAKKVWQILTKKANYEYWTQVFSPKSTYEGTLELGETLRFLDGEWYGLEAIVTVFRSYSQLVFTFIGEISKTGVKAPCASHLNICTKSPLTGTVTNSLSGGYFPVEMGCI